MKKRFNKNGKKEINGLLLHLINLQLHIEVNAINSQQENKSLSVSSKFFT